MASQSPIEEDARGRYRRVALTTPAIHIDALPYASPDFPTDRNVRITGWATGILVADLRYQINEVWEIDFFGLIIRIVQWPPIIDAPVQAAATEGDWYVDIPADTLNDDYLYEFVVYADIHATSVDLDTRPMGQPPIPTAKARMRPPIQPAKKPAAAKPAKKPAKKKK
jgi:hypothetical protein